MQTVGSKGFHLSQQQARLWSLQQQSQAYHTQCSVLLEGALEVNVLQDALREVVTRQGVLRTWFYRAAGMEVPVQIVADRAEILCPLISLHGLSTEEQAEQISACFREMQQVPLEVTQRSLLQVRLLQMGNRQHRLLLSLPSLCADAASLPCLLSEISQAYAACLTAEQRQDDILQYTDVSAWQNKWLLSDATTEQREYWQQFDLSALATQAAPLAHLSPTATEPAENDTAPFAPQVLHIPLSPALCRRMDDLTRMLSVSPEVVLLACWQVFLWRLGLPSPVLIGVACDGRNYDELREAPGLYTRLVPLHTPLVATTSFQRVLTQVQDSLLEATEKQLYFTWSSTAQANTSPAFFPLTFTFESWPTRWNAGPLTLTMEQRHSYQEPFLLQLTGVQQGERLHLELHYDPQRVQPAIVAQLAQGVEALLAAALSEPPTLVSRLPLLGDAAREHLLRQIGQNRTPTSALQLHQLFEIQALLRPDALAVVCEPQSLTYQRLNAQANQVAHALRRQGVGPGVVVGLCVERSLFMLVGMLAILKAGAAYVPLEPEHPQARLAHQLQQAQAPLVLAQESLRARLAWLAIPLWCLDGAATRWQHEPVSNLSLSRCGQDLAYVIYTSGSTGLPKGVMISQESVSNYTQAVCVRLRSQAGWRFATVSTLAADLGNTSIFASLASGGCLHILSYETLTSADTLGTAMQQQAIEVLKIVPSHLSALLAASGSHGQALLPSRCLVLGGESFTKSLWEQLCNLEGECEVFNHYGPTESTIGALVYYVGQLGDMDSEEEADRPSGETTLPIGRPLANLQAYVLDRQQELVPVGVSGEIYLGGKGLARGYMREPEQTAGRFVPNPFSTEPGARLYRTGDIGYWTADEQLRFLGRGDSQVKLRGHRIELGEIETVLRRHPQVWDALALLREIPGGEQQLIAYVVSKEPVTVTPEAVRTYLQEHLPIVMMPTKVMILARWPLSLNGKLDRAALPNPDEQEEQQERKIEGPRSPIEQVLVELWSQVLLVKTVSIHDNFFGLGGHSLLATQVMARLQAILQLEVPILWLFEAPTVAQLAQRVEQALREGDRAAVPALVKASRTQDLPLSFGQQRLWFLDQLAHGQGSYNKGMVMRLEGHLGVKELEWSLAEIVQRHEILRTTFEVREGQPVQVIHANARLLVPLVDVQGLDMEQRERVMRELARQEGERTFDLVQGPLLRTTLLRAGGQHHVLLLSMHHIVSDDWSNSIMQREMSTLYNAAMVGQRVTLPALPVQYADYAIWQRQWLQGDVLAQEIAYWTQQLGGAALLALPTDHPRPTVQQFQGARVERPMPLTLKDTLKRLSQQQDVTLFMLLLTAFQALLARYTGQTDISVGTPIANRNRAESEGLIGFFVNTLVLRAKLTGNPTFLEMLSRVRTVCLEAYAHQDVPFEKLVEALQLERDLSRNPLFQVTFLLEEASQSGAEPSQMGGLTLSPLIEGEPPSKFDLTLAMVDTPQGFWAVANYNTALFEAATIQRLLEHFQLLLEGIATQPELHLSQIPLLNPAQQRQILHEWAYGFPADDNRVGAALDVRPFAPQNDPSPIDNRVGAALDVRPFARAMVQPETTIPSAPDCLHHLVEAQERRTPDAIAVVFDNTQLTYRHLNARANQLAHSLRQLGVRTEQTVGLYLERSLETLVAVLAVLKAGAAYVPLDPIWPQERLAFLLTDAHIAAILTQQTLREHLPSYAGPVVCLPLGGQANAEQDDTHNLDCRLDPQNLAYLIYTSGSTGIPKGVGVSHHAIVNRLRWGQLTHPLAADDRVVQMSSLSFDIAIWELLGPLMAGARVILLPAAGPQESALLGHVLEQQAVTVVHLVPSLVQVLLDEPSFLRNRQLRQVMSGGERLTRELAARFMERMHISLEHFYGPTEAAISMTWWHCGDEPEGRERVPIGRPITNMQGYVMDGYMQLVPPGIWGELFIGGSGLARGYVGQAGLTAERFVPHPFGSEPGARLYRTGDVVRLLDDGNLEYQGRNDHQVKIRGHRIELGEVESGLRRLGGVRDGVVIAREDVAGQMQLVGYVVAEPGLPALVGEPLRQELRAYLPEVMVPAFLIPLDAFPLLPSGKVDRQSLPAPEVVRQEHPQGEAAPQTAFERFLSQIWEKQLGVGSIGRDESFFAVGGDSIKAAIVINQVQERLQVQVYVVAIFDAPTIAGLARLLGQQYPEQVVREFGEPSLPEEARRQRTTPSEHQPIDASQVEALRRVIVPLPPRPHSEEAPTKNPEAIFVLSPPRSGSTLLRVMLAGHPGLFAPPELELLSFNTLAERQETFAGRNAFWLEGTIRVLMELYQCDVDEARAMMTAYEAQGLSTQQFYRVMQQQLGSRRLVEKTPAYALDPEILKRAEADFQGTRYIHLLRHPYGMIRSMEEARLDRVFFRHPHTFALRELAELIWVISQQNITAFLQTIPAERQHQIRFEDLVKQPRETLERLCAFLGIAWEEGLMSPYGEGRMTDGIHAHSKMVGDVKFHTHRQIDAKTADRWQEDDRGDDLGAITWQLAAQLGYRTHFATPAPHPSSPLLVRVARPFGKGQPLSFAQQRLWFLDQLEPGTAAFNIAVAVRMQGNLKLAALERSLTALVERHESLRTTFQSSNGQPMQFINSSDDFQLATCDLTNLALERRTVESHQLAHSEAQKPFDLLRGPLFRATVLRVQRDEHILLLTMHHIVSDGWSMGIVIRELTTLYNAFAEDEPRDLPALPVQYADFALWQRQWLEGAVMNEQVDYWRQQLAGIPPVLALPTDRPRPPVQTFHGAHELISLPAALPAQLKALTLHEGVTMFMLLLATFQVVLSRFTGQEDIVVGTDVANRNHADIEGIIGFFVNQLVLRTDLAGNPTFRQLLQRVATMARGAYKHQDLPFEKLVEVLKPKRSLQYAPLFQVKIIFQTQSQETHTPQGLHISPLELESSSTKLDLILSFTETSQGLNGAFTYNTDLFDPSTVKRLANQLSTVLTSIVANPDTRLNALEVFSSAEKEQHIMEEKAQGKLNFSKLKSIKPKVVSLRQDSLVEMSHLDPTSQLPLVIQPRHSDLDLAEWTKSNLPLMNTELLKHGAILFRGFNISSPAQFEQFAATICPDLFSENGEHPREAVSENVYTPVFYPPAEKLLWHNENSFNDSWPMKIWFYCGKPADQGGETPIVDSRRVFQLIDEEIRAPFMQKQIMYVRNYGDGLGLNWQTVFRTTEKAEVEEYCRKAAIEFEWKKGDRLRTSQIRPAVARHPATGAWVWWNQATHWHPSCLEPGVRDSLFQLFRPEDLPRNCLYGDGTPIADEVIERICAAYQEAEVSFPWQRGDILMLDNMLTAHARNPFQGARKIYVAMGGMVTLKDI